jgi:RsiW-degrading membrane proteinase PrsW (M82 family)
VGVLWRVFGLGILSIFPTLLVAWPIDSLIDGISSPLVHGFLAAFLVAAIPEELFKFLVLWFYPLRQKAFDEPMDGVIYGVTASLGFATLENIMYVADSGLGVAVLRAVTAVPSHACAGAIMGYFAARARLSPEARRRSLTLALVAPTLLHGSYDFPLMAVQRVTEILGEPTPLATALVAIVPIVVTIEWLWTLRIVRSLRANQIRLLPADERLPKPAPSQALAVAMIVAGAIIAAAGAFLSLGLSAILVSGEIPTEELASLLAAGVLFGLAPVVIGCALFISGIRSSRRGAV